MSRLTRRHTVEYADLEALNISKLDQPGGKESLANQVLHFINKNGGGTSSLMMGHGGRQLTDRRFLLCNGAWLF